MPQTNATELASANLDQAVAPVLSKYRGYVAYLRPGQSRDIYPWHTPEDVVMEAANRMRRDGWDVARKPYRGSTVNYSGGHYYLRVTAPSLKARVDGWLCRVLGWATRSFCSC